MTEHAVATMEDGSPERSAQRATRAAERTVDRMAGLGEVGTRVADTVHREVLHGGERSRAVADALHGTWLRHPLHPVLTDVTIGAWLSGALFDALSLGARNGAAGRVADTLATVGTAAAIPTALTGLTDFSTAPKDAAPTATLHGVMNNVNIVLYLLSLRARRHGHRARGIALSTAAIALSAVSAWLGGELVYRHRVGVDHSEQFTGPTDWTPVMRNDELEERTAARIAVDGKSVLLYRDGEHVRAMGAVCPHAGGPLDRGMFDGECVECPWHQSVFDMRSGTVVHGPATRAPQLFDARVRDGQIEIRLRVPAGAAAD
ncbi:MAG TPA: Rieske 2Fe-2S domain-containing protein [Gemmatimonadaceae bacterium]|nr:Rieske 2Fe-2S domain-containing protein [Gemmatimonadaceae bacterium]